MTASLPRRLGRIAAVAGLVAAAVPVGLRVAPRPPLTPTVEWTDDRTAIRERVVRHGLDADGYVHQARDRLYLADDAGQLDDLRRDHAAGHLSPLAPAPSWHPQWTWYGANHVFNRDGSTLAETGTIVTVPYTFVAAGCALPAALWAAGRVVQSGRRQRGTRGRSG